MLFLNHRLFTTLQAVLVAFSFLVPAIISTPASALVGSACLRDSQCASDEYCDVFNTGTCQRDSAISDCIACTSDIDCALGQTCNAKTGCCTDGTLLPDPGLCDCASVGYGGFCSGTDYSTCYNSCSSYQSGGYTYTPNASQVNYPSSCSYSATCNEACTSVANRETRSGTESCTPSCSISNGTCSVSGATRPFTDTCASNYTSGGCKSAGESCSGCNSWTRTSTGTCSGGTFSITCNANYYKSADSCVACSSVSYTDSGSQSCSITNGAGSQTYSRTCYRSTSSAGSTSSSACSGTSSCGSYSYGTCNVTSCTTDYYASSSTACTHVGTGYYSANGSTGRTACTNKPANSYYTGSGGGSNSCGWACNANYYKSGSSCAACSGVSYTDSGNTSCSITNGTGSQTYSRTCYRSTSSAGSTSSSACSGTSSCGSYSYGTCTVTSCTTDYYASSSTACTPVGTGYYSANGSTGRTACTNKPANSYYTGSGGGSNSCGWACNSGYHNEGGTCVSNTKACSGNLSGAQYGNITWNGSAWVYTGCYKDCAEGGIYQGYSYYTGSAWGTCKPISSSSGCHWGYYNNNGQSCVACPAGEWCYNSRYTCPAGYFCPGGTYDPSYSGYGDTYKCPAGYYCPAGSSGYTVCPTGTYSTGGAASCSTCPDVTTYKRATIPAEYYATSWSQSQPSWLGNGWSSITACESFNSYTSSRGLLYDYTFYNPSTGRYDTQGTTIWYQVNPGYYLKTPNSCGSYAYYAESAVCPTGYYCPGKTYVECNSSNASTVHTTYFGLNSCPSGYPNSGAGSDAASDCYTSCTKACTQQSCPSNATCTHGSTSTTGTQYYGGSCSASASTCPITVTCNAGYYLSNGTCVQCESGYYCPGDNNRTSCPSGYPNSSAGATSINSCYTNITRGCTQNNGSTPSGCASVTAWNACSCTGDTYIKYYNGTTSGTTSNETCIKEPKTVTASANYYVSGTTCPACPTAYPSSDGGNIGEGSCYVTKTSTGSQLACSKPANSATYACGTCTPGTCDWRDYKSATDTSCTPDDCTKPVSSVSCNTGYYKDGVMCPACTNKPDNSYYTGTASSNACPWECDDGYSVTDAGTCESFCTSGITHIHLSTGLKIPLYRSARTSPAINVLWNDTICYGSLAVGAGSGLNVKYNGTVYHAVE